MAVSGEFPPIRTLIIIPALNEEAALPAVLRSLAENAPDCDVLVVDDGSRDRTAEVAESHGVRVACLPFNLGVGGALRTGFRYAVRNGYDRAAQFDGDGQHEASALASLFHELEQGADLVIGSRFTKHERTYRAGRIRGGAINVLRIFLGLLTGQQFTDTSSGFRAFSRPMLEFFALTYPSEYLSDTAEALLLACYAGFTVVEVPAAMHRRAGGRPSHRSARLSYHYIRLFVALASMASRRNRSTRRSRG